jgi:hypothetical protein
MVTANKGRGLFFILCSLKALTDIVTNLLNLIFDWIRKKHLKKIRLEPEVKKCIGMIVIV